MYFYKVVKTLATIVFKIVFRININGEDYIPQNGKLILCSNHTSLLDPIMLAIAVSRPITFMAKDELFQNKVFGKLISKLGAFPVDRNGSDLSAIRLSLRTLKDGKVLGIFPEGTRVREQDLDKVKAGIGLLAVKGKSPVIPVYIDSKYNIFGKVIINIGKPIYFDQYYNQKLDSESYKNISRDIMQSIYLLKKI